MINTNITENLQILLYKENQSLLEKINFEDDKIFSDPLLFAYFNSKKYNTFSKELLEEIIQGYFTDKKPLKIQYSYNKNNIAYLPNIGFYNKNQKKIEPILEIEGLGSEGVNR